MLLVIIRMINVGELTCNWDPGEPVPGICIGCKTGQCIWVWVFIVPLRIPNV